VEAQRGAEQVASAAEEQSAGAGEAQVAIQQQANALTQGQVAARNLAVLAEQLHRSKTNASAADQIGAAAEELSATIQELSSAASEIMAAVEQINRGAQQQASATHQTSAALEQIEGSAKLAQKNSDEANDRVRKMEAALDEGRRAIEKLMDGVSAALKELQTSVVGIGRMETNGRQIEKIVDSIALTAIQTNMLAVSGSVEAARAGDAGRGFAVVSNDIRELAREAATNVDQAKDTVRGILDQIIVLKRDFEISISTAEIEIQNNRSVFTALEKVDSDLATLSSANRAILDGAQQILTSSAETAAGARQIAAAAEEANGASRQASVASTEQAKGAEDLAAAIEEIAALAETLKEQNG
jgi:methyl-accepting chemotaxis protein